MESDTASAVLTGCVTASKAASAAATSSCRMPSPSVACSISGPCAAVMMQMLLVQYQGNNKVDADQIQLF